MGVRVAAAGIEALIFKMSPPSLYTPPTLRRTLDLTLFMKCFTEYTQKQVGAQDDDAAGVSCHDSSITALKC